MSSNQPKNFSVKAGISLFLLVMGLAGGLLISCQSKPIPSSAQENTANLPVTTTAGQPGSIAFTGFVLNGNSQFSFVSTANWSAGTTIFFTNYSYDATSNTLVDESTSAGTIGYWPNSSTGSLYAWEPNMATTITEGTIAYVVGSGGLPNTYPSVIISNTSNAQNSLQGGAVYNVAGSGGSPYLVFNHNGAGHKILAWVGNSITVGQPISGVTFIAAIIFGPDSWTTSGSITPGAFWDSYLPSNLGLQSSTDLSANFNGGGQDGNLANDNNASDQNDNAVLNVCQGNIYGLVNPANWQSDANESKTHVSLNGQGLSICSGTNTAGYTGLIQ